MTRSCDSAVVCRRSMASVAICTAVWNPKVTSVADRSLSIVLGTPTTDSPSPPRRWATPSVSSPPMAMRASRALTATVSSTRSTPPSTLYGLVREVPRIVPPRGRMPRHRSTSSGSVRPSMAPRQPSARPTNSSAWATSPLRTTARITAFSPGQSPPPVSTPTRTGSAPSHSSLGLGRLAEQADLPFEVTDILEALVDAGEAQVRHLVQAPEPVEHGDADLLAARLGAQQPDGLLHLAGQGLHVLTAHRPVLGGGPHAGDHFGPVERLPVTRPLDDHQGRLLDALEGGEATAAGRALTPPADGRAVVGQARVHHPILWARARRTAHERGRYRSDCADAWYPVRAAGVAPQS